MPFRLSNHLHGQFSQCYFVHRHLQQCIIQATSFSNLAIISSKALFLNKLTVWEKLLFSELPSQESCPWCFSLQVIQWPLVQFTRFSSSVYAHISNIYDFFRRILFQYSYLSAATLACLTRTHKHSIALFFNSHFQLFLYLSTSVSRAIAY